MNSEYIRTRETARTQQDISTVGYVLMTIDLAHSTISISKERPQRVAVEAVCTTRTEEYSGINDLTAKWN